MARAALVVVLPTPPLPDVITMILAKLIALLQAVVVFSRVVRGAGRRGARAPDGPPGLGKR
jgi:hypothetical protein